jgi:hypothetical protein
VVAVTDNDLTVWFMLAMIDGRTPTIEASGPKSETFGVLVGRLKAYHDDLQSFHIVFEDDTGCIPCVVSV